MYKYRIENEPDIPSIYANSPIINDNLLTTNDTKIINKPCKKMHKSMSYTYIFVGVIVTLSVVYFTKK